MSNKLGRTGRKEDISWRIAFRDVAIASMNKGQFPILVVGVIFVVALLRMPPGDVGKLMLKFLEALERHELFGYVASLVLAMSWFFHSRFQRKTITDEITRLADERDKLQAQLNIKLKSSDRHRQ